MICTPKIANLVDERLHEVDLRVRSRSTGPPSISRVIVIPLQLNLAIVDDERKGLGYLLGLFEAFFQGFDGECEEGQKGVHDAIR